MIDSKEHMSSEKFGQRLTEGWRLLNENADIFGLNPEDGIPNYEALETRQELRILRRSMTGTPLGDLTRRIDSIRMSDSDFDDDDDQSDDYGDGDFIDDGDLDDGFEILGDDDDFGSDDEDDSPSYDDEDY